MACKSQSTEDRTVGGDPWTPWGRSAGEGGRGSGTLGTRPSGRVPTFCHEEVLPRKITMSRAPRLELRLDPDPRETGC